ncbi:MAG: glycosyltransferase family 2 protein, partial [Candidatus Methanofastidiosa archaeon]|nr:glycosyltransferase family 2 protein [Candidatus Methanofastidiosa archaeon]
TDVLDNYRFIKRFFHPALVWYILLVRLISLHNPFIELKGFICAIKVKRINLYSKNSWLLLEEKYKSFESDLIKLKPKVSVIIPTLNRYTYLRDVLQDLQKQEYSNFEVIVCDQSANFNEEFYKDWDLNVVVLRQKEKALWLARNTCIQNAKGEYILLFDDDSRIKPDWISQHLKCIDYFKADISSGVSFSVVGGKIPYNYYFFRWSDQIDTGNVMFRKEMMKQTGMFDRQFEKQRQGDGEFGLRCYLLGFHNVLNPFADRIHLKAAEGGLRQMGSWDGLRPKKIFAPRPVPSVLYLSRKYFGNHLSILMLLFSIPGSVIPYKYKSKKWLKVVAGISLILIWPVLLFQVLLAWSKATDKLNAGPLIEKPVN